MTVKIMFSDIMQCYLAVRYNMTEEPVASISVVRQQKGGICLQHYTASYPRPAALYLVQGATRPEIHWCEATLFVNCTVLHSQPFKNMDIFSSTKNFNSVTADSSCGHAVITC